MSLPDHPTDNPTDNPTVLDALLATTDTALELAMRARARRPAVAADSPSAAALLAAIDTISAIAGVDAPVQLDRQTVVRWVARAMLDTRRQATAAAHANATPAITDPKAIHECLTLIETINRTLDARRC
jgi:hypothetical protein